MASNILQQITRDDHLRAAIFSREKAENDLQAREVHSRKIGWQEGLNVGIQKGLNEGIQKGRQEGIEEGIEKGIEKGIKEGLEKAAERIAQRLEQSGMALSDISEMTNLSIERLKILLNH